MGRQTSTHNTQTQISQTARQMEPGKLGFIQLAESGPKRFFLKKTALFLASVMESFGLTHSMGLGAALLLLMFLSQLTLGHMSRS